MKRLKPTIRKKASETSVTLGDISGDQLVGVILPKILSWMGDSEREIVTEKRFFREKTHDLFFTVGALEVPGLKSKDLIDCLRSLSFSAKEVKVPHPDTGLLGEYIHLNVEKTYQTAEKRRKKLEKEGVVFDGTTLWDGAHVKDVLSEKDWNGNIIPKVDSWIYSTAPHKTRVVFSVETLGFEGLTAKEVVGGLKDRGYQAKLVEGQLPEMIEVAIGLNNLVEQSIKADLPESKLKTAHLFK